MYIVKCATWYIIHATAFTNFLLGATTGLLLCVLLKILLSFTLIFHLWSIMIGSNRGMLKKKLCCFISFQFLLLRVDIHYRQKLCLQIQNKKRKANSPTNRLCKLHSD